jgi:hypothetical protein
MANTSKCVYNSLMLIAKLYTMQVYHLGKIKLRFPKIEFEFVLQRHNFVVFRTLVQITNEGAPG